MPMQEFVKVQKRVKKLERQYEESGPVRRRRLLRTARRLTNREDELKRLLAEPDRKDKVA